MDKLCLQNFQKMQHVHMGSLVSNFGEYRPQYGRYKQAENNVQLFTTKITKNFFSLIFQYDL